VAMQQQLNPVARIATGTVLLILLEAEAWERNGGNTRGFGSVPIPSAEDILRRTAEA